MSGASLRYCSDYFPSYHVMHAQVQSPPPDAAVTPQTAAFVHYINNEKQKGLVDIKFFKANVAGSTIESFCGEVNLMLQAREVADPDLF